MEFCNSNVKLSSAVFVIFRPAQANPLKGVELSLRLLTFVEISSAQLSLVNRVNRLYITMLSFDLR